MTPIKSQARKAKEIAQPLSGVCNGGQAGQGPVCDWHGVVGEASTCCSHFVGFLPES